MPMCTVNSVHSQIFFFVFIGGGVCFEETYMFRDEVPLPSALTSNLSDFF